MIMVVLASCSLDMSNTQNSVKKSESTIELDEDGYIVELGSGLDIDSLSENESESLPTRSYKFFGGNSRDLASTNDFPTKQEEEPEVYQNYEIENGDTLLSIAFDIYGDYRKWRVLLRENKAISLDIKKLEVGTLIRYIPPNNRPKKPEGISYIVKKDETLFKISEKVYDGEGHYWPSIHDNNRPFIRDPNLIFPGFNIYYLPLDRVLFNRKNHLSQNNTKP
jgi:LysM repeat protein